MASALDNIKSNIAANTAKAVEPSLLDKALSFFGIGGAAKPAADPNASAFQNIQSKLGTAPKVATATPDAPTLKIDESKIPKTPPLFSPTLGVTPTVVQNQQGASLIDIFSKAADVITAIPKSIIQSEFNPSQDEINMEKALTTKPDASTYTKVMDYLPNLGAKGVFRFFQPIFQPYADDLSQAIVSQEFAPMVSSGQIPYSAFQKMFPALDKSNSQVIGDSIQAGLATFMPNLFAESAAGVVNGGIKQALATGLKTGAASGGLFGTAQVLSSGTTDPAEIADIYAKNIIGGALLGAVTHGTIPLSKDAYAKLTQNITEKYNLPENLYLNVQSANEALKTAGLPELTPEGAAIKNIKLDIPKVQETLKAGGADGLSHETLDMLQSIGLSKEDYQKALTEPVSIQIPATKILQITDKPWFGAIKDSFGFKPTEKTITVEGKPFVAKPAAPEVTPNVPRETASPAPDVTEKAPVSPVVESAPEASPVASYELKQGKGATPSRITVVLKGEDGIKSPVARVAEAMGGKFVSKEGGYTLPVERQGLFQEAARAVESGKIEPPPILPTAKDISKFKKDFTEYSKNNPEEVKVPAKQKPTDEAGKGKKTSGVAKSIETEAIKKGLTDSFKDLAGYTPATVEHQSEIVSDLIANDPKKMRDIVSGKESLPDGMRGAMFIKGVEDYAQKNGDVQLLQDLASSPVTSETSLHASELRLLQERDPESPVTLIQKVQKARTKAIEESTGQTLTKAKTAIAENIKAEIKKSSPTKQSWEDFVKSIEC